ncbi:MAG: 5-oxoprolinase subunit PxpB [Chthoniobacterales bacterium]
MEIHSLGDSALIVRVAKNFARDPEGALAAVLDLQRRIEQAEIPGLIECALAYESLGIFFDPAKLDKSSDPFAEMKSQIASAVGEFPARAARIKKASAMEIPVCYEAEFAPDLAEVARRTSLSPGEVVRRHSAANYLVHCLGFTPGFPYLGGLPNELSTPRRATPRKHVPAGAVAIGGGQTGIYPSASPGGWNLIGQTPLVLFDPKRKPAALLRPGLRVRFRPISRAEFEAYRS